MSSEELLNIDHPPEHQCGRIDDMIKRVNESLLFSRQAIVAIDPQTIIQANKETYLRLDGFAQELEDLREAIELVRRWGDDWKRLAKDTLNKHEPERLNPSIEFDDDIPF